MAASSTLPTPSELAEFLGGLRQAGYRWDPRQLAAAEQLLLMAHGRAPPPDPARLKTLLAPVFVNSPAQQADFYARFEAWLVRRSGGLAIIESDARPPERRWDDEADVRRERRWRRRLIAGAVVFLLAIGAGTWWWATIEEKPEPVVPPGTEAPPPAQPAPPPEVEPETEPLPPAVPEVETVYRIEDESWPLWEALQAVLTALPLVAFLVWIGVRWTRRRLWLERWTSGSVPELDRLRLPRSSHGLFGAPGFRFAAQNLRRHRRVPATGLDIRKTIEATVAQAGLFTPIGAERPLTPEYLFLIEEMAADDHVARLADEALHRLEDEGVAVERCYFSRDPRVCFRNDARRTPIVLSELAGRTADHRLVIIGTADGFFHPVSGRLEKWASGLAAWPGQVIMSPRPIRHWSMNELALLEGGFSLATATPKGFGTLGDYVSTAEEAPAGELLEGTLVAAPSGAARSAGWRTEAAAPPGLEDLLPQLETLKERAEGTPLKAALAALIPLLTGKSLHPENAVRQLDKVQSILQQMQRPDLQAPRVYDQVRQAIAIQEQARKPVQLLSGVKLCVIFAYKDRETADQLLKMLQGEGAKVIWGQEVPAEDFLISDLRKAIDAADCSVLLWSFAAANSETINAELFSALITDKLVPARLDDSPLAPILRSIHLIDLRGWRGNREDPRLRELVARVAAISMEDDASAVAVASAISEKPASENAAPELRPIVFISYAYESDALRASVKALVDWLGNHGCTVLTDHPYVHRPPDRGWQAWMHDCVEKADVVLVVCTPKMKARYEKNEEPGTGFGATFEDAIVTQDIYDRTMRNLKFFPIIPDGGSYDDVPMTLRPWWNGHSFPSGNEEIRRMIFNEPAAEGLPTALAADAPPWWSSVETDRGPLRFQEDFARKLLGTESASPFFEALQREIPEEFPEISKALNANAVIEWFNRSPADPEHIQRLFFVVRRALDAVPLTGHEPAIRRQCEEAAAALYCLAACRLVDRSAHEARLKVSRFSRYLVQVPSGEHVICALIANALFGGVLRLMSGEQSELPRPEYVFKVTSPASGNQSFEDLERAAFVALFANDREASKISLDTGPLSQPQRETLKARLRAITRINRATLAFVVQGSRAGEAPNSFATIYEVPVMVPEAGATTVLLRMPVRTLLAEIHEFWHEIREMKVWPGAAAPPQDRTSSTSGGSSMASSGLIFNIGRNVSGGLASTAGGHSAAQAGMSHTAHIDHRQGVDLADLIPLLRELAEEIGNLPSVEKRDDLTAHIELAQHEAGKTDTPPDADHIKRALDVIKSGAEGLENGGKIITLCNRAYNVVAPLLGLPPSPLL